MNQTTQCVCTTFKECYENKCTCPCHTGPKESKGTYIQPMNPHEKTETGLVLAKLIEKAKKDERKKTLAWVKIAIEKEIRKHSVSTRGKIEHDGSIEHRGKTCLGAVEAFVREKCQ